MMTQMEEFLMKKKILFTLLTAVMLTTTSCAVDVGSLPIDKIPIEIVQGTKSDDTPVTDSNTTVNKNDFVVTTAVQTVPVETESIDTVTTSVQTLSENSTTVYTETGTIPAVDLQSKAQELYETAGDVYFKMIYTRLGFTLAPSGDDIYSEVVSGGVFGDVTSKEDIKREMRKTFADPVASQYDAMIEEYFKEENGKLYTYINGKGGNVLLENVDLVSVSSDENSAKFNAVAHYTGHQDISRPFSIVCEDGVWKVSEFFDPNCEPLEPVSTTAPEDNDDTEITAMAFEIYKKAHRMFFGILTNGTYYEANGNFIIDEKGIQLNEISDSRVSCIDDIYSEIAEVFSENFISEYAYKTEYIYTEIDGKLYQTEQGKGCAIDNDTAKLKLVYSDDYTLQFDVYNYINGNSILQNMGQFILVYENGGWKVSNLD